MAVSPGSLDVRVLGPLEVRDGSGTPLDLGRPKQRALLALLAVDPGRVVATDRIVFELWGDEPPKAYANQVQVYVSRLRASLGVDAIATRSPGYVLDVDPETIDAVRFAALARRGRDSLDDGDPHAADDQLTDALALWRGSAFADVQGVPACALEASRLEELRVTVVEDALEAALACGRHDDVIAATTSLVADHPLRERLFGHRMLALYRGGRQADALSTYAELRTRLDEELGVEANETLQRLERAILQQRSELDWHPAEVPAAPPDAAIASNVPDPFTSFVGRTDDRDAIGDHLARSRLVTIVGAGGAGKTRLAIEIARSGASAWFVPLDRLQDPGVLADHAARTLGIAQSPGTSSFDAIAGAMGERHGLLVLDNCEHLLDASAAFAMAFLAACPDMRVLATSRAPLRTAGEQVYRLSPLPVPRSDDAILASPAAQLFVERARAVDADFDPTRHVAAVASIVRRLDGMPLAIELAAARTDVLVPDEIDARLDDALGLLSVGTRGDEPHHQTLRATLLWTVDRLTDAQRSLLRKLSVFVGGFTSRHAEAMQDGPVLDELTNLLTSSLIERSDTARGRRFHMLSVTRQLASELLNDAGETEEARRRHLDAIARDVSDSADPGVLDDDADNIHAALVFALDEEADVAVGFDMAKRLVSAWQLRGRLADARRWLTSALDHVPEDEASIALRLSLAMFCQLAGDIAGADEQCRRALDDARATGDAPSATRALLNLGNVAVARDDMSEARRLYGEAVDASRAAGLADLETRALANMATVARRQGDADAAHSMSIEALRSARRIGDPMLEGTVLLNLGEIERLRGDHDAARRALVSALDLSRDAGHAAGVTASLGALGNLAQDAGDLAGAEQYITESVDAARTMGNQGLVAAGTTNLGSIAFDAGRYDEALERFKEARRFYDAIPNTRGVSRACRGMADALRELGETRRSARLLITAFATAVEIGDPDDIERCRASASALATVLGVDGPPDEDVESWLRAVAEEYVAL